jgi:hypothetical protein
MIDIEKAIQNRIALAEICINDLNSTVIVRKQKIEIKTLRSASRDEQALELAIKRNKAEIAKIIDVNKAQPLNDELDALEWLLPRVRLKDTSKTENDFC